MSFVTAAIIGAGGAIVGGMLSGSAAKSAAATQAAAADRAAELQYQQWKEGVELQEPWRQAGINALNKMGTGFTGKVDMTQDPGYQFRLSEGLKALDRQAAARGGLISGAALKASQRYGQDYASNEYQNAYNRALSQYNTTAALAGVGQTATNQMVNAGQAMASNVGEAGAAAAQARASGYIGQSNALTGALSGVANSYMQGQMLNRLLPPPSASYASYVPTTNYSYTPDYSLGTPRL